MKSKVITLSLFLVLFVVSSCAVPIQPPVWRFEKEAIHMRIKSSFRLNLHEGKPHTLMMCIYQLRDKNTFNHLAGYREGIYKLLECELYDASVASVKRLIIHPGQDMTFLLDRSRDAKYVGFAAGYFLLEKKRMIRLMDIPVVVEEKGIFQRSRMSKPGVMDLDVSLGELQIEGIWKK